MPIAKGSTRGAPCSASGNRAPKVGKKNKRAKAGTKAPCPECGHLVTINADRSIRVHGYAVIPPEGQTHPKGMPEEATKKNKKHKKKNKKAAAPDEETEEAA